MGCGGTKSVMDPLNNEGQIRVQEDHLARIMNLDHAINVNKKYDMFFKYNRDFFNRFYFDSR